MTRCVCSGEIREKISMVPAAQDLWDSASPPLPFPLYLPLTPHFYFHLLSCGFALSLPPSLSPSISLLSSSFLPASLSPSPQVLSCIHTEALLYSSRRPCPTQDIKEWGGNCFFVQPLFLALVSPSSDCWEHDSRTGFTEWLKMMFSKKVPTAEEKKTFPCSLEL